MLAADSLAEAEARISAARADARVAYWWDGARELGPAFAATLGLSVDAWDVYLLYPRGARWQGDLPPAPASWMHQLWPQQGAPPDLRLEHARLTGWTRELLDGRPAQ